MTQVESAELDGNEKDGEVRWVVCVPVWVVVAGGGESEPERREVVPGVDAVAAWWVEREAARRLTVVERLRPDW